MIPMQRRQGLLRYSRSGPGRSGLLFGLALVINAVLFLLLPWLTQVQQPSEHKNFMSVPTKVAYAPPSVSKQQEPLPDRQEPTQNRMSEQALPEIPMAPERPPRKIQAKIKVQPLKLAELMPKLQTAAIKVDKPVAPPVKQGAKPQPAPEQPGEEPTSEKAPPAVQQTASPAKTRPQPPKVRSGPFALGDVDQRPRPVKKINPVYPFKARRQNIEGTVMLECLVDSKGKIKEIRVISAEPEGIFEASAKEALEHWRFRPGKIKGRPVSTRIRLPFRFQLQ